MSGPVGAVPGQPIMPRQLSRMRGAEGLPLDPEVQLIRQKRLNDPWPKFLRSLTIEGLRGWQGQEVRFQFPVVAVAGENGTGKSTVLKAAAAAYAKPPNQKEGYFGSVFFPDTAWEQVDGVSLTYKVVEGTTEKAVKLTKVTERWNFTPKKPADRPKRYVVFQDISRTLPIEGTVGYARIAQRNTQESGATALDNATLQAYSNILGRTYTSAKLARSDADDTKDVGVVEANGVEYSAFHQGAGEDATFDLLTALVNVPDYSLVIIDEVEASLHPRSQRRLIRRLLKIARLKQIQFILSTHSPFVLEELPEEARVLLLRGPAGVEVVYGASPEYALTRMDDVVKPDLYLCTEDKESSELALQMMRRMNVDLLRVKCVEVGPGNVVRALGTLANEEKLPFPFLGVVDGDQTVGQGCIRLPGTQAPERQVVHDIRASALPTLAQRLEVTPASLNAALTQAETLGDHHQWLAYLATQLNQTPQYLWATMAQVWVKHCLAEQVVASFVEPIQNRLAS